MEYLIGSKKEFKDFVDSVGKEDKIGVLTHRDLDGIASAIFLEKILESRGLKVEKLFILGTSKGVLDIPTKAFKEKGITKVFLTDLTADSFDLEGFENFRENFDCFLIDHHPIIEGDWSKKNVIKTESDYCVALVMYDLAKDYLNVDNFDWLITSAIIADWSFRKKENFELLKEKCGDIDSKEDIDKSKAARFSNMVGSAVVYFDTDLDKVYKIVKEKNMGDLEKIHEKVAANLMKDLDRFRKEAEYDKEKNLYYAYFNVDYNYSSILCTVISKESPDAIYVFAMDHFHRKGAITVSLRNQSGRVDMNAFARKLVEGLEASSAGGHLRAAGAGFLKKDLAKFKERLLS